MFTRRQFLKSMLAAGGLGWFPLSRDSWAFSGANPGDKRLIVLLMRGAVDGLSIVAPYAEDNYYALRPNIALPKPGQQDGLIDLDGFFGLHPALAALLPQWRAGTLAFIHAGGSPAITRSHFEAQDIMETARLNSAAATQGWLNGLAQVLPDNHAPSRALSVGNLMPKIFQGKASISAMPAGMRPGRPGAVENPQIEKEFARLYAPHPELNALYRRAVTAREEMQQDLQAEMIESGKGAPSGDAFVDAARNVAAMLRHDDKIQLVFMDAGGWDTHIAQGAAKGQLAGKLEKFASGLSTLADGLGPVYRNTVILIMSEFGRTVAENGNKGTDHGHGNVCWIMGGAVNGAKVHGRWPGLNGDQLWEGRDLAVTTDFRDIIAGVVTGHFGLSCAQARLFIPDYTADLAMQALLRT
ncbi:MAG: DUF1501 domain-containing protein [Methylomonas sp.]